MLVYLIELVVAALIIVGCITQVVIPLLLNKPLFPWYWNRQTKLKLEEEQLNQIVRDDQYEESIDRLRREVKERVKSNNEEPKNVN